MTRIVRYPCGCASRPWPPAGALRCVRKCRAHRRQYRAPEGLGAAYYEELGAIRAGAPAATAHVAELEEALGPLPAAWGSRRAVELGPGASPYAGELVRRGWAYEAVERSPWAARWLREHFGAAVAAGDAGRWEPGPGAYGLALAAHSLEHLEDAPGALRKVARALAPGGEAFIVVPGEGDPVNPDHLWNFAAATLRACLEAAGLEVMREATRRIVPREDFLYARAVKR